MIWDRLLGCFGESLLRKFGAEPPEEWAEAIGMLHYHEVGRGMRRLVFGWKGGPPNLPDFIRLCRSIGEDEFDDGPRKLVALPPPDDRKFDGADLSANERLLKYITTRLPANPHAWGLPGSAQQREAVQILVAYKNAWAQDMREWGGIDPSTGELVRATSAEQDSNWKGCMERAEADIALLLRRKAA